SLVVNAGVLVAILSTHLMPKLVKNIDNWVLQLIVVLGVFIAIFAVVDIPVSVWTEFVHEKKWGFSTNTPGRFVGDFFKGLILGVVIQVAVLLALWWLIRTTPTWWWVAGWAVFFAFGILLALLFP